MKIYDGEQSDTETPTVDSRKVGIAEYEVAADKADLTTSGLGSCVGVALHDPVSGIAGLVHVMLPEAEKIDEGNAAKFADAGTELLVDEMVESGASLATMRAKIAGGSDMLDFTESGAGIGKRNIEQVRETLSERDVPVVGEDVGGDSGRSLRLEANSGDLVVTNAKMDERRL